MLLDKLALLFNNTTPNKKHPVEPLRTSEEQENFHSWSVLVCLGLSWFVLVCLGYRMFFNSA